MNVKPKANGKVPYEVSEGIKKKNSPPVFPGIASNYVFNWSNVTFSSHFFGVCYFKTKIRI